MPDDMGSDHDIEIGLALARLVDAEQLAEQRQVAEQWNFRVRGQRVVHRETTDYESFAVADRSGGLRLALADRRITLLIAGDARDHRIDMRRHEPIRAHPR